MNGSPIRTYWPQLTVLVLVSVAWGSNVNRIANAEGDIVTQEERLVKIEENLGAVKDSVIRIDTTQGHIADDVKSIESAIQAILNELRED